MPSATGPPTVDFCFDGRTVRLAFGSFTNMSPCFCFTASGLFLTFPMVELRKPNAAWSSSLKLPWAIHSVYKLMLMIKKSNVDLQQWITTFRPQTLKMLSNCSPTAQSWSHVHCLTFVFHHKSDHSRLQNSTCYMALRPICSPGMTASLSFLCWKGNIEMVMQLHLWHRECAQAGFRAISSNLELPAPDDCLCCSAIATLHPENVPLGCIPVMDFEPVWLLQRPLCTTGMPTSEKSRAICISSNLEQYAQIRSSGPQMHQTHSDFDDLHLFCSSNFFIIPLRLQRCDAPAKFPSWQSNGRS